VQGLTVGVDAAWSGNRATNCQSDETNRKANETDAGELAISIIFFATGLQRP
jgi:hypothetical protein